MRGQQVTKVLTHAPEDSERLLSIEETRERLAGITRREIYKRLAAGDFRSTKLGRRRVIVESSLNAYIARLIANSEEADQ